QLHLLAVQPADHLRSPVLGEHRELLTQRDLVHRRHSGVDGRDASAKRHARAATGARSARRLFVGRYAPCARPEWASQWSTSGKRLSRMRTASLIAAIAFTISLRALAGMLAAAKELSLVIAVGFSDRPASAGTKLGRVFGSTGAWTCCQ